MSKVEATSQPPKPRLEGRRTRLRNVEPGDYDWLFKLFSLPELGYQWRWAPGTLDPDQFRRNLWQGVLVQLIITHKSTNERLGAVLVYQANHSSRFAYLGVILDPGVQRLGWPLEGFKLFLNYVFITFDLRKLYAEATDYNMAQYRSIIGKLAHEEGLLRNHLYVDGRYHDVHLLAFYREDCLLKD